MASKNENYQRCGYCQNKKIGLIPGERPPGRFPVCPCNYQVICSVKSRLPVVGN